MNNFSWTWVLFLSVISVQCQDTCMWSTLTAKTHATGSDAFYEINSTTHLRDGIFYTWRYNKSLAAQLAYSSSTGNFTLYNQNTRVKASATKFAANVVVLSATVKNVTSSDDGAPLQISRSECDFHEVGGEVNLTVKDCDKEHFYPNATANTSSACGYGCSESFVCNTSACYDGTFQGECLADATWIPLLPSCSRITCDILPARMQFPKGVANVECGSTEIVQCTGGMECGSTTGTCVSPSNQVALEDATFDCSAVCDLNVFSPVASSNSSSPHCGDSVNFKCNKNSSCGAMTFTRTCGRNGTWNLPVHPCEIDCQTAVTWAIVFGVAFALLWAFHLTRVLIQCCDDNCCCFSGGKCCKLEGGDGHPPCVSVLLSPVLKMAECLERRKCCCRSFFWTAYAVYSSILSLTLIVAALVLLVLSKSGCCGSATMIGGITVGFIALAVLIAFIVLTFLGCTGSLAAVQLKKRVSPGSTSSATCKHEAVQLTENSNDAVA